MLNEVKAARHVLIIGNGGSYANAIHICNDLLACGIKAFTLDPATLTASANDYGYETVFARWVECVGEPGDLLIALSGSGKSANILNAIRAAEYKGMTVYRVFGEGKNMQLAEEEQIRIGHEVMKCLRNQT